MLRREITNQFKKDYKHAKKRGRKLVHLEAIIESLALREELAPKFRAHKLSGNLKGYWECHVEPDTLLMYEYTDDALILVRLGTHADLF